MDVTVAAEAHLKVIRSLMERSTVYRAISSATAMAGGLASFAAAFFILNRPLPEPIEFLIVWGAVLLITLSVNAYFVSLGAEKRGEPLFSRGMKITLLCTGPCLLAGGVVTATFFKTIGVAQCSVLWMIFYGLALTSTYNFAPRSVVWLGIAFLLTGLALLPLLVFEFIPVAFPAWVGSKLMAATFGLYHLIYAAATWPRKGGFMGALELNR